MANNPKGVRVNAFNLASLYLKTAGLPDTKITRQLLAAWFMAESQRVGLTDIVVYGNNPLNITSGAAKSAGVQTSGVSNRVNHSFAVFASPQAGAAGWWKYLNWGSTRFPAYKGIITALRIQDPKGFVAAIKKSPWGTSGNLVASVLATFGVDAGQNVTDSNLGPGQNVTANGSGINNTSIVRWAKSVGKNLDEPMSQADILSFAEYIAKAQGPDLTASEIEQTAKEQFVPLFQKFLGMTPREIAAQEVKTGNASGTSPSDFPNADPFAQIAAFFNDLIPNVLWLGAVVVGAFLMWKGASMVIHSASNESSGTTVKIAETTRYPVIVKE